VTLLLCVQSDAAGQQESNISKFKSQVQSLQVLFKAKQLGHNYFDYCINNSGSGHTCILHLNQHGNIYSLIFYLFVEHCLFFCAAQFLPTEVLFFIRTCKDNYIFTTTTLPFLLCSVNIEDHTKLICWLILTYKTGLAVHNKLKRHYKYFSFTFRILPIYLWCLPLGSPSHGEHY